MILDKSVPINGVSKCTPFDFNGTKDCVTLLYTPNDDHLVYSYMKQFAINSNLTIPGFNTTGSLGYDLMGVCLTLIY
jgi:hypothetical protein